MTKEEKKEKTLDLLNELGKKLQDFSDLKNVNVEVILSASFEIIQIQQEIIKLKAIKTIQK